MWNIAVMTVQETQICFATVSPYFDLACLALGVRFLVSTGVGFQLILEVCTLALKGKLSGNLKKKMKVISLY